MSRMTSYSAIANYRYMQGEIIRRHLGRKDIAEEIGDLSEVAFPVIRALIKREVTEEMVKKINARELEIYIKLYLIDPALEPKIVPNLTWNQADVISTHVVNLLLKLLKGEKDESV